jgi:hypothetical protein
MIARAEKLGVAGKYIEFTQEIVKAAQELSDAKYINMVYRTIKMCLGFAILHHN